MVFGRGKKTRSLEEVAIIFDIGSASIGGALVKLVYPGKPEILYSTRKQMKVQKQITSEALIRNMGKALKDTALDIQKRGLSSAKSKGLIGNEINNIYCTFSAPWYISQTKSVNSVFNTPKVINSSYINKQIEQEENDFLNTGSGKYSEMKKGELHLLEHSVIQLRLNGYETNNPEDKTVKHMNMSIFMSMIPDIAATSVLGIVSDVFNSENLHMHSFGLASYSVLRSVFSEEDDFLLLDISGEVTDVLLIKNNVLVESMTFPFGKYKLARDLAESLKTTEEEAISKIVIHGDNDTEGVVVLGKTKKVVADLKERWNNNLKLVLRDFSKDYAIPQKMFFLADDNVLSVFKHFLETSTVAKFISPDGNFTAKPIDNSIFNKYVSYPDGVAKDPFLAIESIFFNTAHKLHD